MMMEGWIFIEFQGLRSDFRELFIQSIQVTQKESWTYFMLDILVVKKKKKKFYFKFFIFFILSFKK